MKLLAATVLAAVTLGGAQAGATFVGTISDDMCGLSHASMRMGPTDAECAHACVEEHDAAYVLVDGKSVYRLSDQKAARPFAGKKARVTGTLDTTTMTITVKSISGG